MGRKAFVPKRKIYKIEVDTPGHPFEDMFVRARSVPMGKYMDLAAMHDGIDLDSLKAAGVEETTEAFKAFASMRELFLAFGKALIEWNIEEPADPDDDDSPLVPVPATFDGLMSQDFELVMFLVTEWLGAMGGTTAPLGQMPKQGGNSNGADSPETALAALSRPLSSVPS